MMTQTSRGLIDLQIKKSISNVFWIKVGVLFLLCAGFAFAFSYLLNLFFTGSGINFLYWSLATLVLFLSLFLLQTLFFNFNGANLFIFAEAAALAAGFISRFSALLGLTAFVSFLLLLWGNSAGRNFIENSLKAKFGQVGKIVLPKAIAAASLLASVMALYYFNPDTKQFIISREVFGKVFEVNEVLVKKFLPGFDSSVGINVMAQNIAREQLVQQPELSMLPKAVKEQLIMQSAKAIEENIVGALGQTVDVKKSLRDVSYDFVKEKFDALPERVKTLAFLSLAALIFLSVEIVALPVRVAVIFLAFIFYEILFSLGLARAAVESRQKETLTLE